MTRIYEDYPELFYTSEDGRDNRIKLIQRLTKERLEAHEREDILKLAQLTGQRIDADMPLPMLREEVSDLMDNTEVWQSSIIIKEEDIEGSPHHPEPIFTIGSEGYEEFLRNIINNIAPDDYYAIANINYLERYKDIRDQALRVMDWGKHGGYLDDVELKLDTYAGYYVPEAWDDANAGKDNFLKSLNVLPDDLFDLIVLAVMTDCETVAAKMVEDSDKEENKKFFDKNRMDLFARSLAKRDSIDYLTDNFLSKITLVGLSKQFTEAWAERLASSSSMYCHIGAASSSYTSILIQLKGDNKMVDKALAGNPSTPVDMLKQFVHDDDPQVRAALASHCDMKLECFQPLASDADNDVINQVLDNPLTPDALIASIVERVIDANRSSMEATDYLDNTSIGLAEIAGKVRTPSDLLRRIYEIADDVSSLYNVTNEDVYQEQFTEIYNALAANLSTPSDVLEKIYASTVESFNAAKTELEEEAQQEPEDDDEDEDDSSSVPMTDEEKKEALEDLDRAMAELGIDPDDEDAESTGEDDEPESDEEDDEDFDDLDDEDEDDEHFLSEDEAHEERMQEFTEWLEHEADTLNDIMEALVTNPSTPSELLDTIADQCLDDSLDSEYLDSASKISKSKYLDELKDNPNLSDEARKKIEEASNK